MPQVVNLPPEENGDPQSVYVVNEGHKYRLMTIKDFRAFRERVTSDEGWTEKFRNATVAVFSQSAPPGTLGAGLNIIKVIVEFPGVAPSVFYDALHDPDFRKSWDDKMISGINICQLDPRNDIGYYAAKFPFPLANRDFVNLRAWIELNTGEYIIMNRSVLHPAYPVTSKFVRGLSYATGYYLQPLVPGGDRSDPATGVRMLYLTHSDPQGSIPYSLLNMAMTTMAPNMMATLGQRAKDYPAWAAKNHPPGWKGPWLTPLLTWEGQPVGVATAAGDRGATAAAKAVGAEQERAASPPTAAAAGTEQQRTRAGSEGPAAAAAERRGSASSSPAAGGPQYANHKHHDGHHHQQHHKDQAQRDHQHPQKDQSSPAAASPATGGAGSEEAAALRTQLDELKRRLRTAELQGLLGADDAASIAPVAPRRHDDPPAVQQFRAMMSDALNFVDRQYLHEGRAPSSVVEYLTRVRAVVDGIRKTIPAPAAV